jgi:hypothetical protein
VNGPTMAVASAGPSWLPPPLPPPKNASPQGISIEANTLGVSSTTTALVTSHGASMVTSAAPVIGGLESASLPDAGRSRRIALVIMGAAGLALVIGLFIGLHEPSEGAPERATMLEGVTPREAAIAAAARAAAAAQGTAAPADESGAATSAPGASSEAGATPNAGPRDKPKRGAPVNTSSKKKPPTIPDDPG